MAVTPETLAKHFAYLDGLQASGQTNTWAAVTWLAARFDIDRDTAGKSHSLWIETFDPDKSAADRAREALTKSA